MKQWTGFLLLILLLIPGVWTFAVDNTQAASCQLDLSPAVTALQAAQQAIDKGDMDSALHTVGEARNMLQLLEAQCADYAPKNAGNSRTNPVPFGQPQHAKMGKEFSGSIQLIDYIDNAADYVEQAYKRNVPAPEGTRYIVFRLKYACEKPTSESCNFSSIFFKAVGDKGLVYDYTSDSKHDVHIVGVGDRQEIFGGTEIEVDLAFLVEAADNNFVLFTEFNDPRVFFASK
jgi:hypothetical protein